MGAKRIRVSIDNGVTFYTLPGTTGEKRTELQTVNDTIFGQDWQSENPNIGQAMITANGYYKGVAGYTAVIKKGGTPTTITAEACALVSGKTYQVTNTAKRMISYADALTVLDNGVDHTADVLNIDYLYGLVTFKPAYTVTGPVTITGKYIPLAVLAKAKGYSLTQTAAEIDTSTFEVVQANGGWRTYDYGLRTVAMELQGLFDAADTFLTEMANRTLMYVDVSADGSPDTFFRGFFKRSSHQQTGDVGALEATTLHLVLAVPYTDYLVAPFAWYFTNNTLMNVGLRNVINAWQNKTLVKVQYLPDGLAGQQYDAIITEASLSNAFDGQNEFRFSFRCSGAATVI